MVEVFSRLFTWTTHAIISSFISSPFMKCWKQKWSQAEATFHEKTFRMFQISSSLMGSHNSVDSILLLCVMSLKIVRPSIVQWIMTSVMKMWTSSILHPTNQLISIVPINVHQFIVDSEIYGTVIMMHSQRRDEWMTAQRRGYFYGATFTWMTCGCKQTSLPLNITFLLLFAWPLTNVCRNSQWWRFNDTKFDIFQRWSQFFCYAQLIFDSHSRYIRGDDSQLIENTFDDIYNGIRLLFKSFVSSRSFETNQRCSAWTQKFMKTCLESYHFVISEQAWF